MAPNDFEGEGMVIAPARSDADVAAVLALVDQFRTWIVGRYPDSVEGYYPAATWPAYLRSLPARHAPPDGDMLLARLDGAPAGCIMMERFDAETAEMKRTFVADIARRRGVGRALCLALIDLARARGFRRMRLEAAVRHAEALPLYRSVGFRDRALYRDYEDDDLAAVIVPMEVEL